MQRSINIIDALGKYRDRAYNYTCRTCGGKLRPIGCIIEYFEHDDPSSCVDGDEELQYAIVRWHDDKKVRLLSELPITIKLGKIFISGIAIITAASIVNSHM